MKDKLGKLVQLAKRGVGGEKTNALRMVKRLCKKHNMDFESVMNDNESYKFELMYRRGEEYLATAIVYRFASMSYEEDIRINEKYKYIAFFTTKERFIETQNAYIVLSRKYREEKKLAQRAFVLAFRKKHSLYYNPTEEEWEKILKEEKKKKTKEEEKMEEMANGMTRGMDSVQLQKQLTT